MKRRVRAQFARHFSVLDKQIYVPVIDKNVAERDRVAGHVRAADVEKPHNAVELTVNIDRRAVLMHHVPEPAEL